MSIKTRCCRIVADEEVGEDICSSMIGAEKCHLRANVSNPYCHHHARKKLNPPTSSSPCVFISSVILLNRSVRYDVPMRSSSSTMEHRLQPRNSRGYSGSRFLRSYRHPAEELGQTPALKAGFDAAVRVIIAMDGDLQHDPAEISLFSLRNSTRASTSLAGWRARKKRHLLTRRLPSRNCELGHGQTFWSPTA